MWPFKKKTRTFFVAFICDSETEKGNRRHCIIELTGFISAEETLDMLKARLEKGGYTKVTWTAFNEIPSE